MVKVLSAALTLCALTACTTTHIDQFRQTATSIKQGGSIVVLGRRQNNNYDTPASFVSCVATTVASGGDRIKVIPEQEFLDAMFPYFEPRTAPLRSTNLKQLLDLNEARKRLNDYGLEYIVWVDGTTERKDKAGGMSCAVSPAGGGCFGFNSWADASKFEAEIWDINTQEVAGSISTDSNGQSYLPAVLLPIPLIARVEANACSGLGDQLKQFIGGKGI